MSRRAVVQRIAMASPDDTAGLSAAIEDGRIEPGQVVAIFGKTEGNGCVNDWTRALAVRALKECFARHVGLERAAAICMVMSGGTEGGLAPHVTVFESRLSREPALPDALAIGIAHTVDLPPEAIGRLAQVEAVAEGVGRAMRAAGLSRPEQVHFVQVKCPLLIPERIAAAEARGRVPRTRDALKSMGLSRAAASLGVAVALGEVEAGGLSDDAIGADWRLYSGRASASAGVELLGHEIVVLGRGGDWSGPLRIDHATMADALDVEAVRAALARLGLGAPGQLSTEQRQRLVAVLAKAESASTGEIRGLRHRMLEDSDIAATRHARGFVGGVLAGLIGHTELYVSGGAEHQGPDGGGPVALIAA